MTQSSATKEEVMRSYIDQIYANYDTNNSGLLTLQQTTTFFNHLFQSVQVNISLTTQQTQQAIRAVYPTYANSLTKQQLFQVFKTLLGISNSPQQSQNQMMNNTNVNQFTGYNSQMNPGMYYNSQNFYQNNLQQSYLAQLAQNQNYMMAQNLMRQGQNMQGGYQMNNYGSQNNNGGQQRR